MHSGRPFKGLIVARCKAVITEWVNVQFKRDLIGRQRLHIEQAVRNWDSAVCRGMPQKRRRRIRPNLFVAGKFSNFLRCALFCSGQGIDTAQMRPHGIRRDDRIAEDRRLHRLAVRKNSPNFRAIITCCVMCRQMPARGEAEKRNAGHIAMPCGRILMDQFHAACCLPQLRRIAVRLSGVIQDKDVKALGEKVQRDRLGLPLAAILISAARADDQTGAQRMIATHFRQIVRKIGRDRRITAIFAKRRKIIFQMQNFIFHVSLSICSFSPSQRCSLCYRSS